MTSSVFPPSPILATAANRLRHVFVRDLIVPASVGVWSHEKGRAQRVRINIDLGVGEPPVPPPDRLDAVVCYDRVTRAVRALAAGEHVHLLETLAERIAAVALEDPRVRNVRVRVEKLDVYADAASVGVEIERIAPE
ncbi:MAG: dihydroneopterin aldolase [Alphaproteobacteria bacterium]|nr:dihydroneopterin aldolase [Alphaproteobacteria bacterium]